MDLEQATDRAMEFMRRHGHHECHLVSGKCEDDVYKIGINIGAFNKRIIEVGVNAETGEIDRLWEKDSPKTNWRPDGWSNPYTHPSDSITHLSAFEGGANAMLKALKEKGAWMTPKQMKLLAPDRKYPYGYLVFIPSVPMGPGLSAQGIFERGQAGAEAGAVL